MDYHGGDYISLFTLRLKSNNKPAILIIAMEPKMTINLKPPAEEACELFPAFQHMEYDFSDKIGNQFFQSNFCRPLTVLIDTTLIL